MTAFIKIIVFTRMSEVDDNLNYMLGQLSLVVSEFNQVSQNINNYLEKKLKLTNYQVKTGLGKAMEGIGDELLEEYKKSQDAN